MPEPIDSIGEVDPGNSVLFLGSGFSLGASNTAGGKPPNGAGLRKYFINELNLPDNTEYDLQVLTEEFANEDSQKLSDELHRIFRISSVDDAQAMVLSEPWRRIYTTNYDDSVEVYRQTKKLPRDDYDVSQEIPNKFPNSAVVHLHGSIRLVTPENVLTSLVLSEASYVNQYVVRSPWYDQFQRDIAFANALYIVGYSLADYHIAALLLENPETAKRTIFIQGPNRDEVLLRRTASYGRTLFIGTKGFADALKTAPRPVAASDVARLKSFRLMNPVRDRKAVVSPTANEVYELLVYGNFDPGRLARSLPNETYAVARTEAVQSAVNAIEQHPALVIDGRLGNGKTLFLYLLASALSQRNWTCLLFRPGSPDIAKDVGELRSNNRVVIFIEQYSAAQQALQELRTALPDAKFVIEVRTGTFEVRYHEVSKLLPREFDRISVNNLTRREIESFANLCNHAGLPSPTSHSSDLRDVLLELFNNRLIQERIKTSLSPLFEATVARKILVITMLIAAFQRSVGAVFIRSIVGVDPFTALKKVEYLTKEIFEISPDDFRMRSSVFSEFVIKEFITSKDISDAVVDVALAAAARKSQSSYRVLMSNVMAYSNLRRVLRDKGDVPTSIFGIYERLRHDERVSGDPLFWLQYAMAMADVPKLDTAWAYIQAAYRKADERPDFETFQIDTQALRIALMVAAQEKTSSRISNIEEILAGLERIDGMLSEDSHRTYAVKVLDGIPQFVSARRNDMSLSEATAVQFWVLKIVKSLSELPLSFKITTGSELIRTRLQETANQFLTATKT